jgi:membrane protease YdiL (CAAX protease family)
VFDLVEETTMKLVKSYSPIEFAIVVFVIGITPAICEEMLFRGFVLKNLEKVAKANIAIFLTGFLFALYHLQPFNLIPLMILGTFLAFVVYYSNSIFVGMLCHFLNNFFAAYFVYMFGKQDIETPRISHSETADTIIIGVSSLVLFVFVIYLFYKFRYKKELQNE